MALTVQYFDGDLSSNYSRFLNRSSALHGDNQDQFLYQICSLRKDSGIDQVDFLKKSRTGCTEETLDSVGDPLVE